MDPELKGVGMDSYEWRKEAAYEIFTQSGVQAGKDLVLDGYRYM